MHGGSASIVWATVLAAGTLTAVSGVLAPVAAETPAQEVLIAAEDNGSSKDVVRLQADDVFVGGVVELLVIRGTKIQENKQLIKVREKTVPADGLLTFNLADRNGDRRTRYLAKVTIDGIDDKSNTQKPR